MIKIKEFTLASINLEWHVPPCPTQVRPVPSAHVEQYSIRLTDVHCWHADFELQLSKLQRGRGITALNFEYWYAI